MPRGNCGIICQGDTDWRNKADLAASLQWSKPYNFTARGLTHLWSAEKLSLFFYFFRNWPKLFVDWPGHNVLQPLLQTYKPILKFPLGHFSKFTLVFFVILFKKKKKKRLHVMQDSLNQHFLTIAYICMPGNQQLNFIFYLFCLFPLCKKWIHHRYLFYLRSF